MDGWTDGRTDPAQPLKLFLKQSRLPKFGGLVAEAEHSERVASFRAAAEKPTLNATRLEIGQQPTLKERQPTLHLAPSLASSHRLLLLHTHPATLLAR